MFLGGVQTEQHRSCIRDNAIQCSLSRFPDLGIRRCKLQVACMCDTVSSFRSSKCFERSEGV
eukprot:1065998-Amphidinium_carterae.1